MYFHYLNDQQKYKTKTITEKDFLNYYSIKNDVHDIKWTASDFCPSVTSPNNIDSVAAVESLETLTEAKKAELDAIRRIPKKFICINDILDYDKSDTEEVLKITKDWYAKIFRKKSPFELWN